MRRGSLEHHTSFFFFLFSFLAVATVLRCFGWRLTWGSRKEKFVRPRLISLWICLDTANTVAGTCSFSMQENFRRKKGMIRFLYLIYFLDLVSMERCFPTSLQRTHGGKPWSAKQKDIALSNSGYIAVVVFLANRRSTIQLCRINKIGRAHV